MREADKGEIAFERVIFFSDAIVAIAITLLALDLKLQTPTNATLTFQNVLAPWRSYLAFILSFVNIAGLWKTHHYIFIYIKKMNEQLLTLNICWLFLIITLPFATTLVSAHFGDKPAILVYSLNIFLLAVAQNFIWDYSDRKTDFIDREKLSDAQRKRFQLMFNLDMLNGLIAVVLSFFMPTLAFILLFFKVPMFVFATVYIAKERRKGLTSSKDTDKTPES